MTLAGLTVLTGGGCASARLNEGVTLARPAPWSTAGTPVRWVSTAATADQAALAAWRSGVGQALRLPAPPGLGASTAPAPLVFISWNVHVGGGDLAALVEDLRQGILTDGVPVRDFVLLLQEVHRERASAPGPGVRQPRRIEARPPSGVRIDVVEAARALGLNAVYAPSMGNGWSEPAGAFEDRGNAILSTLPLDDPMGIELPYEGQRRVAVTARVEVGFEQASDTRYVLRVASAHLDNRARWSRVLDSFGPARTRQAQALAAALDDEHVVLGADLNTWAPGVLEGAPEVLEASFSPAPGSGDATFRLAGLLGRQLDHLLVRLPDDMGVRVRVVPERYGSDHHPVLALVGGNASGGGR